MLVMQISKHDQNSCPMFNDRSLEAMKKFSTGEEAALKRHKVKLVGSWTDFPAHKILNIYDAPSMEEFLAMCKEPEFRAWMSFNVVETRAVIERKEVMEMLKQK
jgi:hypothetical protein